MISEVLEKPSEVAAFNKFCHIVCLCTPKISLCGAYKPVRCEIPVTGNSIVEDCVRCHRPACKECLDLLMYMCPNCGE